MGGQRAALALYTGEWITADDAVACGLALRVVEPDALLPRRWTSRAASRGCR